VTPSGLSPVANYAHVAVDKILSPSVVVSFLQLMLVEVYDVYLLNAKKFHSFK